MESARAAFKLDKQMASVLYECDIRIFNSGGFVYHVRNTRNEGVFVVLRLRIHARSRFEM